MRKTFFLLICVFICSIFLIAYGNKCEDTGEHDMNVISTVPNTCTESGSLTWVCSVCGYTFTETIIPHGHDYDNGICKFCHKAQDLPSDLISPTASPEPSSYTEQISESASVSTSTPVSGPTPEPHKEEIIQQEPEFTPIPDIPEDINQIPILSSSDEDKKPVTVADTPVPLIPSEPAATAIPASPSKSVSSDLSEPNLDPEETVSEENSMKSPGTVKPEENQAESKLRAGIETESSVVNDKSTYALELSLRIPDSNDLILFIVEKAETEVSASQDNVLLPASFWCVSALRSPELILQGKCMFESSVHHEKTSDDIMNISLVTVDVPTLYISSDILSVVFIPDEPADIDLISGYFGISGGILFSAGSEISGTFYAD